MMILFIITLAVFLFAFVPTPFILNYVYGSTESEQKYPLAFDENGDKLEYNDCPGYDDGIDPSQYDSMTIEELEAITVNVDWRILNLTNDKNFNSMDFTDEESEELDCLSSIRAVEVEAANNMRKLANDVSELTDLYSDQLELNERWDTLNNKYD